MSKYAPMLEQILEGALKVASSDVLTESQKTKLSESTARICKTLIVEMSRDILDDIDADYDPTWDDDASSIDRDMAEIDSEETFGSQGLGEDADYAGADDLKMDNEDFDDLKDLLDKLSNTVSDVQGDADDFELDADENDDQVLDADADDLEVDADELGDEVDELEDSADDIGDDLDLDLDDDGSDFSDDDLGDDLED